VLEDAITHRAFALTGEASYLFSEFGIRMDKERSKDVLMQWEVADDSVVVLKFRPMKPGNSVEDKTGMTWRLSSSGVNIRQKPY